MKLRKFTGGWWSLVALLLMISLSLGTKVPAQADVNYLITNGVARLPLQQGNDRNQLQQVIDTPLADRMATVDGNEQLSVILTFTGKANLRNINQRSRQQRVNQILQRLRAKATADQRDALRLLRQRRRQGAVSQIKPLWVVNAIGFQATPAVITELGGLPGVDTIQLDVAPIVPVGVVSSEPGIQDNLTQINTQGLWGLGNRGEGLVVAALDTGVDSSHADLAAQWRGGSNSWFDPYGQFPTVPTDSAGAASGHGTAVMGVMVGRDNSGNAIGVAPNATWIAAKIFNSAGGATITEMHQAFQWILDPDGDPNTDDAPHVVNNSWTYQVEGCFLEFEPDLLALSIAGILPIFAAGNGGPGANTSYSPANNPSAFAVGAVDTLDQVYAYSSRGPASCGDTTTVYPAIVAPGVQVQSADLYGFYQQLSGTSIAAPHVSGILTLLLQAFPGLTADEQAQALRQGVVDLGEVGPDHVYGYGRLDAMLAYGWLNGGSPGATPTVTATSTFTPTVTATTTGTATPTATSTATATPTATPTATASPTVSTTNAVRYFSFRNNLVSNVGGVANVRDEDVMRFDGTTFSLFFDGSDVGLATFDLDAFAIVDESTLLMSFQEEGTIQGLAVDDSDIVQFSATSLGEVTTGTFSIYLDGSDVGLTTNGEDIDALYRLPDGDLIISVAGVASVPGLPRYLDEDLLRFTPQTLGNFTSGSWSLYFDGSDVGLADTLEEDVWGVAIGGDGKIYLTLFGAFAVEGASGAAHDILICTPLSLGEVSSCLFSVDPDFNTLPTISTLMLDAMAFNEGLSGGTSGTTPTATPTATAMATATSTLIPTATATATASPTLSTANSVRYFSFSNNQVSNVGGVENVRDEDVMRFDGANFSLFFDGSDVGLADFDLNAFTIVDESTLLMSFQEAGTIQGLVVDDSDIVQFSATSLGETTAGTFSIYLDGSDVDLTTNGEDIDAISRLPNGDLVISTVGVVNVPGLPSYLDEDLLQFSPQTLGNSTSGSWSLYFDSSDVGLADTLEEDVSGVVIDNNNDIYMTTMGAFSVEGASGGAHDILICTPLALGEASDCVFSIDPDFNTMQIVSTLRLDALGP